MKLHFDRALVDQLLAHSKAAPRHAKSYGQEIGVPSLWLVGDQGVYLMSNGEPPMLKAEGQVDRVVCYAHEADPTRLPFDEWWAAKRASFGGDDGVESLNVGDVEKVLSTYPSGEPLVLDVTPDLIRMLGPNTVRARPRE
jgi:Protein of unknown function (DUF3085)